MTLELHVARRLQSTYIEVPILFFQATHDYSCCDRIQGGPKGADCQYIRLNFISFKANNILYRVVLKHRPLS